MNHHFPSAKSLPVWLCLFWLCFAAVPAQAQLVQLTISGTAVDSSKVYDGTTWANIDSIGTLSNLVAGDSVLVSAQAHYLDPNVGTGKTVVVSYLLLGPDAAGYLVPVNDTLSADILPMTLYASGVRLPTNKIYDGTLSCNIVDTGTFSAPLAGDTVSQLVTASFRTANVGFLRAVDVTHIAQGPQGGNYIIADTNHYAAQIIARQLYASEPLIFLCKEYDGNDTAIVSFPPELLNDISSDSITLAYSAHYDNPEVGDHKPITIYYSILGDAASNYVAPADSLITDQGCIIMPTLIDTLNALGQTVVPTAEGFCHQENVDLIFRISQGEIAFYNLLFSDEAYQQGFIDRNFTPLPAPDENGFSHITFPIAPDCASGNYSVRIELLNRAAVSTFLYAPFSIFLSNNYIIQVFNDVVSIDNSGRLDGMANRFTSYQWYHDGTPIDKATKPYYQDPDGLNGTYSVRVNIGTEDETMVCPTQRYTIGTPQKTITISPSPVINAAQLQLHGFDEGSHQLYVYSNCGALMRSFTFSGTQCRVDLSNLPLGTYLVCVDGTTVKTIKR